MRTGIAVSLIVAVASGCGPEGEVSSRSSSELNSAHELNSAQECEWLVAPAPDDPSVALCDVEFREVVRLEGSMEGVAPDRPVHALWDGRYVTGTYSPGRLALWAPDGRLLEVLGTGPGEGPGEFNYATEFAQTSDDEFLVFTGHQLVHRYSTTEGFLRSFRLPTFGGVTGAAAYGDVVVVAAADGWRDLGFQIVGDRVQPQGVIEPTGGVLLLAAGEGVGVWSATAERYVLRRHTWPGGTVVDSLVVNRDWFRGPEGWKAFLFGIQADVRGLIWVVGSAPDPDAPPRRPTPAGVEVPVTEAELAEAIKYTDFVIDAFAPDGRLVASRRFDTLEELPRPMPGGLWFRPTEDGLSVVVLQAVLVAR